MKCFVDMDQLAVKPATAPVIRPAFEMRNREDHNFVFPRQINNREGKLLGKDAPSAVFVRRTCKRQ